MESFKADVTQKLDSIMDLLRNPMSRTANPISPSEVKEPTQINPKQSKDDVDRVKKRKCGSDDDNPLLEWFFDDKRSGTYVSFENDHVNGDGLYSLRPGVWIIDEVINAHECVLRFKDSDKAPRNLYLPTYFAQLPEDARYNVFQRCVGSNRTLSRCSYIYIPMNMENRHWYLIRADIETKKAAIFDSYLEMNKAKTGIHEVGEVLKSLHNCLLEHAKVDESFSYSDDKNGVWKISTLGWVPQQKNGYDCGVFAMLFMEQGKNLTRETRFETEKERRRIALQLLHHPGNERRSQVLKMLSSTLGGVRKRSHG
nr:ubiquitin-like-specific protease ESD4 [Ipomoea batatas]GME05429.1 ubiquitin-like-specific protease ESD4 [Ipomoea batatas]